MASDEETNTKKEEKATGKWAAEAYDLFKLFSRTGRTFYGLIVLLLGWTLLILLLGKLPAEATKPTIAIPWPQSGWSFTNYTIPVQNLFVPGASPSMPVVVHIQRLRSVHILASENFAAVHCGIHSVLGWICFVFGGGASAGAYSDIANEPLDSPTLTGRKREDYS